jgi:hypothetical protein
VEYPTAGYCLPTKMGGHTMKRNLIVLAAVISVVCTAFAASLAVGQNSNVAGRQAANIGTPVEKIDLGESSRAAADVSRFLAQPKLAEVLAAARGDKAKAEEARRNANEFLARNGVQVPANAKIVLDPSGDGAAKLKVKIEISCCPLTIVITIRF